MYPSVSEDSITVVLIHRFNWLATERWWCGTSRFPGGRSSVIEARVGAGARVERSKVREVKG